MTALAQYRTAKESVEKLREPAKQELISRYYELVAEMQQVRKDLLREFGIRAVPKAKRSKKSTQVAKPSTPVDSAKLRRLEKRVEAARAKAAKAPNDKAAQDRLYEVEDALRLEREKAG